MTYWTFALKSDAISANSTVTAALGPDILLSSNGPSPYQTTNNWSGIFTCTNLTFAMLAADIVVTPLLATVITDMQFDLIKPITVKVV